MTTQSRVIAAPRFLEEFASIAAAVLPKHTTAADGSKFITKVDIAPELIREVFLLYQLEELHKEPMFGCFVGSHSSAGTKVKRHIDTAPRGFWHVRCNFVLEMPVQGGYPVLGDTVHPVSVGDIWVCFASKEPHASTPITEGQRVVVSLGALVPSGTAQDAYTKIVPTI